MADLYHRCTTCTCCGTCCCHDYSPAPGLCPLCGDRAELAKALDVYLAAQVEGGWYVQKPHGLEKIHGVGCPTFNGHVRRAVEIVDSPCTHEGHNLPFPKPIRAEAVKPGERCKVCAPDVTPPPKPVRGQARIWWRKSGTGWPSDPRRNLTDVLGHPVRTKNP